MLELFKTTISCVIKNILYRDSKCYYKFSFDYYMDVWMCTFMCTAIFLFFFRKYFFNKKIEPHIIGNTGNEIISYKINS